MVILDSIQLPNKPRLADVIGGSGSFVTLGQRLFATEPARVGCLIIAGEDFPKDVEATLDNLGITLVVQKRENALSTRGLLEYEDDTFGPKNFTYTGGPLRATVSDLTNTPLLHANAFHFFGTPEEILTQVPELLELRGRHGIEERPLIIWEPFPAACKAENLAIFLNACKHVDVFSPNHLELQALFADGSKRFEQERLENHASQILKSGIGVSTDGPEGLIIVRAGEHGALARKRDEKAIWSPPYYEQASPKIVDPTGAGNTFLGGYISGQQVTNSWTQAVSYGHVAASFALEQIGLPKEEIKDGVELWNGVSVLERLEEYKARLRNAGVKSECFV
ncbi:Ribokinase-like protein [Lophiostoma macrostomum CBS 122681]|uniref:Ribokinase-like protein n=1 Tax=Lophiostoma macrostomum CBS 122681 TaxID=1314788 RepID=A0A6A6TVJ5_9PLEO|nr:Ribokinase-like protein [Lophiostoma macrostomum CBS 122681]